MTERSSVDVRPRPRPNLGSRRRVALAVALAVLGVGFLVWKGLDDATVYFRTADEAVADRADLGTRRFRIEGTVVDGSVREADDGVRFVIAANGTSVGILHHGDPPELFQPGIPVVLEGRWAGERFTSDRIMVKHSSEYKARNPERVKSYTSTR